MFTLIISFLIILLASIIQGMTSFGFSLIAVPLLGLFLPLKDFVPMLIIYSFLISLILFKNLKGNFNRKRILVLVLSGLSSTVLGVNLLKYVDNNILKMVVGFIIFLSSLFMMLGIRIKVKVRIIGDIIAGVASGLLNGSVSFSGPPVILLLSNEDTEKEIFRKTLTTYFMILNFVSLPLFFFNGLLSKDIAIKTLINFPAMAVGLFLGFIIGNRITEEYFKKIALGLILFLGIVTILSVIL